MFSAFFNQVFLSGLFSSIGDVLWAVWTGLISVLTGGVPGGV